MKRLQTGTFSGTYTQTAPTLIATFAADADRLLFINWLGYGTGDFDETQIEFFLYATLTRSGYAESLVLDYGGQSLYTQGNIFSAGWVGGGLRFLGNKPAWTQPERNILVHTGDVINVYLDSNVVDATGAGFVEFYGTETLAEIAAAVLAAGTFPANVTEINSVAVTGDGDATPWGPA
jgi:hypothetical protein